jgi:hypothetical protein
VPIATPNFFPSTHSSLLSRLLPGTGHDLTGAGLPATAAAWVHRPRPPAAPPPHLQHQTEPW